jgi:hypothetical protein
VRELGLALGTLGLLSILPLLVRMRAALRGTTLVTAWNWGAAGVGLWCLAWAVTIFFPAAAPGLTDQIWYAAALVLLCSTIAVLGAKRPGSRVWSGFVLVPLLFVLGWPALFAWRGGGLPDRLYLSREAALTYSFVCVMGVGNYLGTRFALSGVLHGLGLLGIVASVAALRWSWLSDPATCRIGATFCLSAAVWHSWLQRPPRRELLSPLDRVWIDFRDAFGLVWARRIQDRFNDTAQKSRWPARLELDGLHWQATASPSDNTASDEAAAPTALPAATPAETDGAGPAMEAALRWLLRRFVDPDWIDARLSPENRT